MKVKCIWTNSDTDFTIGKTYDWPNPHDDSGSYRSINILDGKVWKFELMPDMNEILEEAKRMYPIGTKMKCLKDSQQGVIIIEPMLYADGYGNEIDSIITKYKDRTYNQYIYLDGKWAETISLPDEQYVECIKWNGGYHTAGIIYKMKEGMIDCPTGRPTSYNSFKHRFVMSTKKAYDAQSKPKFEFVLPAAWYIVATKENQKMVSKWKNHYNDDWLLEVGKITGMHINGCKEHNPSTSTEGFGIEITTEQFKKYVLKQTNEFMKTFLITRSQFQTLYEAACDEWKSKITTMVTEQLGTFGTKCDLPYNIVESMFDAANRSQTKVLLNIFPEFRNDNSVDITKEDCVMKQGDGRGQYMIEIRTGGDYMNKAFYLNEKFEWTFAKDDDDNLCLVPTRK